MEHRKQAAGIQVTNFSRRLCGLCRGGPDKFSGMVSYSHR